ncbi:LysM peptidoglycan-binding domain-containing protein [Cohnella caldifontis]|uniref:LysM peptidoglycan-binding domain-containing protein n=1 Tax=Cohnella caldifontis TaxID=3027471 RepID=UPI0023EAA484|nr:LysM peptidoglycan-binding domain-containing protein [Cohnella sp. YIM B05605]
MTYGIHLSWNNQAEGFPLPVMPSSIEISDGNKGQTYDVAQLGEINVIKNPKLTTYRFSSIFPSPNARRYFTDHGYVDPLAIAPILLSKPEYSEDARHDVNTNPYVHLLKKWMASKRPIRFVFTGDTFDLNVAASIESFEWKEIAGSGGDIEYTLTLQKYVFYAARRVVALDPGNGSPRLVRTAPARPNDRQPPKSYTMRAGDTLWKVAKTQLGDGARWREIQRLNGIADAQVKSLPIGKTLKLPT